MLHHGIVYKARETNKLRILFHGSAKQNADEFSLNEHLDEGPNYIPSFDVLVKFRVHPIALTADVEKAFLQIQIKHDNRDMLRFLWFDDVNSPDPCIVQFRFCRLPFGLLPSPSIPLYPGRYCQETLRKLSRVAHEYCRNFKRALC